jgi:hypothetical protein
MTPPRPVWWSPERPGALVVACSDGRLQGAVDAFLEGTLGITDYDRLYLPGGPAALAASGEYLRADHVRRELSFLLAAHGIERLILLFHGPAEGGPDAATCADYRRRFPGHKPCALAALQARESQALFRAGFGVRRLEVRAFRAEVGADLHVQFTELFAPQRSHSA